MEALLRWVYEEKEQVDMSEIASGKRPRLLMNHLPEIFLNKFGLRTVADKHLGSVFEAARVAEAFSVKVCDSFTQAVQKGRASCMVET